jgi:hypothetical protein
MVASIANAPDVALVPSTCLLWTLSVALGQVSWWVTLVAGWRRWGHHLSSGARARWMRGIVLRAIRGMAEGADTDRTPVARRAAERVGDACLRRADRSPGGPRLPVG